VRTKIGWPESCERFCVSYLLLFVCKGRYKYAGMSIKKIKGNGVAWVDAIREKVAFTDEQRHKFEQIYRAIRSDKSTVASR
jgi:hypothetical protein